VGRRRRAHACRREIVDVAERRHEVRRSVVVTAEGADDAVAAAQTIRRTRDNVGTAGL
jgi:hypothetical protein